MDIRIDNHGEHFKFRVCGILTHNNKFLAVKIANNSFYCFPGGHAEIGEDTITATKREMQEELGFPIVIKKLACIAQNLFKTPNGEIMHEFSYYYLVEAQDPTLVNPNDYELVECDKGEYKTLRFKWLTKEEMEKEDFRPTFANKIISSNTISHIVNKYEQTTIEEFSI